MPHSWRHRSESTKRASARARRHGAQRAAIVGAVLLGWLSLATDGHAQEGPSAPSDAARPDAVQPDAVQPDAVQPGAAQPGAAQPGAAQPGSVRQGSTPSRADASVSTETAAGARDVPAGESPYAPPWLLALSAGGQINNLVGGVDATLRYRKTYGRDPTSLLMDNLYWEVGGSVTIAVIENIVSVFAEWSPLALLRLRLSYRGRFTLGIANDSGAGLAFANATTPYGDAVLIARANQTEVTYGHQVVLEPILQAKVWRLIVLNKLALGLHYFHGGPGFLYQAETDNLIARGSVDFTIHEQPIVLFDIHQGPGFNQLYAGAYYELDYTTAADTVRHRVGAMAVYSPVRRFGMLFEPTLLLGGGMNLVDRNRAMQPFAFFVLQAGLVLGHEH